MIVFQRRVSLVKYCSAGRVKYLKRNFFGGVLLCVSSHLNGWCNKKESTKRLSIFMIAVENYWNSLKSRLFQTSVGNRFVNQARAII